MKKILGILLALAMLATLAIPAMAVGVPEPNTADYEYSYKDQQWDQGYDDGYKLGYADAAAGLERKTFEYVEGTSYEDGKYYGYDSGYDDFLYEKERQENVNQAIKDAGGVPGQINVKLNDRCVVFPDAVPELQNGNTMVPVRAVMEALGATLELQENNVLKIVCGDKSIQMTIGDQTATVEQDGSSKQVDLGAASYLKNGRVYVPLRFVSETFGFAVYWDQDYKSVVLLDRAAIVNQLNERFSTANVFMKSQAKLLTGNWLTKGDFNISIEIIDSIDGNKTYTATGTTRAHSSGGAMTMDASLDLSNFAGLLNSMPALTGDQDFSNLDLLKTFMKVNKFSMKVDPKGDYYVKSELYDLLATTMLGMEIDTNKETWYRLGHIDPTLLTTEGYTVGGYLCAMMDPNLGMQSPFLCYDAMMQSASQLERFLGNDTFAKHGEGYSWSMNKEMLLRLSGQDEETVKALSAMFQDLDLTITFNKDGVYSIQGAVKLNMTGLGSLMNMSLNQSGTSTSANSNMKLQVRNLFNLTMKANSKASQMQTAPDTSIPETAQIIDLMQMLMP